MEELKTITDIVETIMQTAEETRNNDNLLYLRLLDVLGKHHGIDYIHMTVIDFFRLLPELNIPTIETVSRIRRKVQQEKPELKSNAEVTAFRAERKEMFREYARK